MANELNDLGSDVGQFEKMLGNLEQLGIDELEKKLKEIQQLKEKIQKSPSTHPKFSIYLASLEFSEMAFENRLQHELKLRFGHLPSLKQ